jgi:hypothetical protein
MQLLRRFLLGISLLAGLLSPLASVAQAPPPVPALPDTERLTAYSLTNSTCKCALGFALYGDSTDYGNWLQVLVNGVSVNPADPSFGWVISSPTGPLATIPRPITDAILTFNVAQTATVQIVGARRPRRTTEFSENRGVAARDLNQALNDIVAQNRETWDKVNNLIISGGAGSANLTIGAPVTGGIPGGLLYTTLAGTLGNTGSLPNAVAITDNTGTPQISATLPSALLLPWAQISGTPNTLAGYGITNALTNSLPSGDIFVGAGSGLAAAVAVSGDCSLSNVALIICTKTAGVNFGTMATQFANNVSITGGSVTGLPTPVNASDAATKAYVDANAAGLTIHAPSSVATAGAVLPNTPTYNNGAGTLTSATNVALTVDSVVVSTLGTRVLVKDQASGLQNGIYTLTQAGTGSVPWILTRATDFNTVAAGNVAVGTYTFVSGGTVNAGSSWVMTTTGALTLGTTALVFTEFASTAVQAGTGLSLAGSTLSIANTGVGAGGPTGNATTVPVITYNAQGQLTAVTTASIAAQAATYFVAAATGGSANVQTIATPTPNTFTLTAGYTICAKAGSTNTAATTLNVQASGAVAVNVRTSAGLTALGGGEIISGVAYCWLYDGTVYELMNVVPGAIQTKTGSYTATEPDGANHATFIFTGASNAVTIPQSSTLTANWNINVFAEGGPVTITPNAADAINGGTAGVAVTLQQGYSTSIATNGAGAVYVPFTSPLPGAFTTLAASGNVTFPGLTTSGTIANSLCTDSSGHVISHAGAGCFTGGTTPSAGGRVIAAANAAACASAPPVQTANISGGTAWCYIPYLPGTGNVIWINGTNYTYTAASITLNSGLQLANKAYDIWATVSGGVAVFCIGGNAWSSNTARNDGILQNANGLYTNSGTLAHCYNNATDYGPISAGGATGLSTGLTGLAGQTNWSLKPAAVLGGTNNVVGVCNFYNRVPTFVHEWDNVSTYTENGSASGYVVLDAVNGGNNIITYIDCLGSVSAGGSMDVKIDARVGFGLKTAGQTVTGGAALVCTDYGGGGTCAENSIAGCAALNSQMAFGTWSAEGLAASLTFIAQTVCSTFGLHTQTILVSAPNSANGGAPLLVQGKDASGMLLEGMF